MLREDTVFGPIYSRRLGSSLGINLLPRYGKLCNFDCVYCECGWNKDGRNDRKIPTLEDVKDALESTLSECKKKNEPIDSITFSGDGEPTLNPEFPEIIDATIELRDKYYPQAEISVLSNSILAGKEKIFNALKKVDNPIMKIDAPTNALVEWINKPTGTYEIDKVVDSLKKFNGDFVLQTMFLRGPGYDSAEPKALEGWYEIVRTLRPRLIMAYTIARAVPMKGLEKFTVEEMEECVRPLKEEGFKVQISG